MHASTRWLALRAAAKIALCVSFVSCGGVFVDYAATDAAEPPADDGEPSVDASARRDASADVLAPADAAVTVDAIFSPDVRGDAATACGAPAAGTDAGISEGVFTCCVAEIHGVLADPDATFVSQAMMLGDAETQACCSAVVRRIDQDHVAMSPDLEADYAAIGGTLGVCCDNLNPLPRGPACAP